MFDFVFDLNTFLSYAGSDPFTAMWYLFLKGGWLLFLWVGLWIARTMYLDYIQSKTAAKKEYAVFRVTVPRVSEQTPKAVENIFASFAAAYGPPNWTEKWIKGEFQTPLSIEIISLEGEVMFCVQCEKRLRDLIEASIYAQYPDADIDIIDDYTKQVPAHYPDEVYDLWGTEVTNTKDDAYPIKTYVDFTDPVSGEIKDPLATLLENFSRLGAGEQLWYQIVLTPTDQKEARARAEAITNKMKGVEPKSKSPGLFQQIIMFPFTVIEQILGIFVPGFGGGGDSKPEKKDGPPKILTLSPGERAILEAIERKTSKIGFMCKIRIIYVARKEAMKRAKVVQPFLGSLRQFNTLHMQTLVPNSKKIGINSSFWILKDRRNNYRKNKLIRAFQQRSDSVGLPPFFLCTEELATLWHFPNLIQVKAPQLRRTQSKKTDPPAYIPFSNE